MLHIITGIFTCLSGKSMLSRYFRQIFILYISKNSSDIGRSYQHSEHAMKIFFFA